MRGAGATPGQIRGTMEGARLAGIGKGCNP